MQLRDGIIILSDFREDRKNDAPGMPKNQILKLNQDGKMKIPRKQTPNSSINKT